jgi:CHAT domain-containing protein
VLVFIVSFGACKRRDPAKEYEFIRLNFLHGHLAAAQEEIEKATQQLAGSNPEWVWKFRLLQAEILINRGLGRETLFLLSSRLPASLSKSDLQTKKYLLESLANMALGNLSVADERLQHAEQLSAQSESELSAEIMAGRGILEVRQGNPEQAEVNFRKALQLAHKLNAKFVEAAALLNLSVAAVHRHHYDEAIDWSNRASDLARVINAGLTEEKALGNSGWSYYQMGDLNRSLALSLDAEKRARDLGIVKDQIRWLYNSGGVYNAQSELPRARECYQKAFELASQIGDVEQTINALSSLSSISVQQGRFDLAEQYSQKTFDLAHAHNDRLRELYSLLTKGQIAANRHREQEAEQIFQEIARDSQTEAPLLWETQNELAHLYENQAELESAEKQYQAALSTLECARGAIDLEEFRLSFLNNAAQVYDDYLRFLTKRGKIREALRVADYGRAQTLAEGLGLLKKKQNCAFIPQIAIAPQSLARKSKGPILFYWLGEQRSYLWVLTLNRTELFKLPPAFEIEGAILRYRKALLDPPDVLQNRNADGIKLYEILVAPAKQFIQPNSQVTIVADGSLNNLNFETLLVPGDDLHYWIQDVTVSNASSLRLLAVSNTASKRKGRNLLLIGAPLVPDAKFPPLPNAKTEMQNVEQHFDPTLREVSSGQDANPAAYFKSKPETFSYIHFVAHGTSSQLSPLDSAVILSKATNEEDSYKLHARDIVGHRLRADLVVISACYGSGTTLYNGEGLVGLSWAFVRAGAHNVIGALWQVNDTSTPRLMDQMYSEIQKGKSPQEALRTAKLSLLHSDNSFRKPIYWAPFQFYTGS